MTSRTPSRLLNNQMTLSPEVMRELERLKKEFAKNVSKSLNVFKTPVIGDRNETD